MKLDIPMLIRVKCGKVREIVGRQVGDTAGTALKNVDIERELIIKLFESLPIFYNDF